LVYQKYKYKLHQKVIHAFCTMIELISLGIFLNMKTKINQYILKYNSEPRAEYVINNKQIFIFILYLLHGTTTL